jgi:drug/metabolite transporter (DMT)-like permease
LLKPLSDELPVGVIVVLLSVIVIIALLPMALVVWVPPSGFDLVILFGVVCLATLRHFTITLAFKSILMSFTQPVTFMQLVWAVTLGPLVFDEALDPFVILGIMIILASVTFITWREALLQRRSQITLVLPPKSK